MKSQFRVWEEVSKTMHYDVDSILRNPSIIPSELFSDRDCMLKTMWNSNLIDKNGNDIYQGDIIKNERGDWGVVVIKDHCFETTVSENQSSLYTKEYYNNSEVIGNIYENPELLTN